MLLSPPKTEEQCSNRTAWRRLFWGSGLLCWVWLRVSKCAAVSESLVSVTGHGVLQQDNDP